MLRIFLSHSGSDAGVVTHVEPVAQAVGARVYLFEQDCQAGANLAAKVQSAIRRSDIVVVIMTKNTSSSSYVHQEIGYAIRCGKRVIPLLERGAGSSQLGMLQGIEYVQFDADEPTKSMQKLTVVLQRHAEAKAKEELAVLLVIGAALLALSSPRA